MNTSTPSHLEHGRTLHASRRLDWRFLLSDPTLDSVAYLGAPGGMLLDSIRAFSRSVEVLDERALLDHTHRFRYDVLVLDTASRAVLRQSGAVLKPGGSLYAEIRRFAVRHVPHTFHSARSFARLAGAAGFADVHVQWHWPTFETCTRIVPLDEPTVLSFLLTHGRGGAAASARASAGRALMQSGLLGWMVPCFSIVGRVPVG